MHVTNTAVWTTLRSPSAVQFRQTGSPERCGAGPGGWAQSALYPRGHPGAGQGLSWGPSGINSDLLPVSKHSKPGGSGCVGWFCVRSGLAAAVSAPLSLLVFLWDPSPRAVFAFAPPWSGDHHPPHSCSAGPSCPRWLVWVWIGLVPTTGGRGCTPGMLTAPPAWVQPLRSVPGSPAGGAVIAQRGWPLGRPSFKGIGSKRCHRGDSATCLLSREPSGAGRGSPFWVLPPPALALDTAQRVHRSCSITALLGVRLGQPLPAPASVAPVAPSSGTPLLPGVPLLLLSPCWEPLLQLPLSCGLPWASALVPLSRRLSPQTCEAGASPTAPRSLLPLPHAPRTPTTPPAPHFALSSGPRP